MDPKVRPFFQEITRELARGMSLQDLATAHALARELSGPLPDAYRVALLREELGLPSSPQGPSRAFPEDSDPQARLL